MVLEKQPHAEPLRGYRLLEPLGRGGFGEVWKCEAPGGIHKAIKFVYGSMNGLEVGGIHAEEELRAIQHIKSIRHPFLLSIDRVECIDGELVIVTELADQNLHELWEKYRAQKKAGVPRQELLGYLKEAAEVLDLMNLKFDLQHLDVKPRNLFLVCNHVKVADFGLVNSLAGGTSTEQKLHMGAITPLYAAPEIFQGKLSRHADQYSLAIVFQELLTGTLPFNGKNTRQLLLQHVQGQPDLSSLPEADRKILTKAMSKKPDERFGSCMDLICALAGENAPRKIRSQPEILLTPETPKRDAVRDTVATGHTEPAGPRRTKLPPALVGYEVQESLGRHPLMERWKVLTHVGEVRQLQILYGLGNWDLKNPQSPLAKWRSLHHPGLASAEIVHVEPGRAYLLTDLAEETLRERFQTCQKQKLPGIRRGELLENLRAAAEVLDYMYQQHGVQHLALNPRSLLLDHGWLRIADFGLAQVLWVAARQDITQYNARYAAPELLEGRGSRACDQYSLALIYTEMLTGVYPFKAAGKQRGEPNLDALSDQDRPVIARALHPDPKQRWGSLIEMIMTLEGTPLEMEQELRDKPDRFAQLIKNNRSLPNLASAGTSGVDLYEVIAQLIVSAGGDLSGRTGPAVLEYSSSGEVLTHKFEAGLPIGSARLKLEGFAKEWFGNIIRDEESDLVFQLTLPSNFWNTWLGKQPGLEVHIHLERANPQSATPIEVSGSVRAFKNCRKRSVQFLEDMGPGIMERLRQLLLTSANKRAQERILWPHPVIVHPLGHDGSREDPVECRGKDISPSGMGFYLPHDLASADLLIELPRPDGTGKVLTPATLVRARCCADGWYDVGALFRLPARRKSAAEIRVPVGAV